MWGAKIIPLLMIQVLTMMVTEPKNKMYGIIMIAAFIVIDIIALLAWYQAHKYYKGDEG